MLNKKIQMAGNTGQTVGTVSASDHLERAHFVSGELNNDFIRGIILFFICIVAVGWFKPSMYRRNMPFRNCGQKSFL